jgi:hypothetical protein
MKNANTKAIQDVIRKLGRWYGIQASSPFESFFSSIRKTDGAGTNDPTMISPLFSDAAVGDVIGAALASLVDQSTSIPSTDAIMKGFSAIWSSPEAPEGDPNAPGLPVIITPYDSVLATSLDISIGVNKGYKDPAPQGYGKPTGGVHYTTSQDLMPKAEQEEIAPVTVIQIFSPIQAVNVSCTDVASIFMNSIPPLELSRAVPYMEVTFSVPNPSGGGLADFAGDGQSEGNPGTPSMSTMRFLMGRAMDQSGYAASIADEALINGPYDNLPGHFAQQADTDIGQPATLARRDKMATVAAMDIFTMPQTMVNAGGFYDPSLTNGTPGGYDPFKPFMSIESFKCTTTTTAFLEPLSSLTFEGPENVLQDKTGNLQLRLHDRGRLNDIAPLVKPKSFGSGHLRITYGWSHPDGSDINRPSDADYSARFGDLINAMKITEIYHIENSEFSFAEGGEISLNLTLQEAGGEWAKSITEGSIRGVGQHQMNDSLQEMVNAASAGSKSKKVLTPSYVLPIGKTIKDSQESLAAVQKLIEDFQSFDFSKEFDEAFEKVFNAGQNSEAEEAVAETEKLNNSNMAATFDAFWADMMSKPDPFLRPATTGATSTSKSKPGPPISDFSNTGTKGHATYVSLGKVLTYIMGGNLQKQNNDYEEIQFLFYPFNAHAGAMYNHNLSQFPMEQKALKKHLAKPMKSGKAISVKSLLGLINDKFMNSPTARAFGNPVGGGKAAQKKLRDIYGIEPSGPVGPFQIPRLAVKPQIGPSRTKLSDGDINTAMGGNILRLHIYDTCCSTMSIIHDLKKGLENSTFSVLRRDVDRDIAAMGLAPTSIVYGSNHQAYYDVVIQQFEQMGAVVAISDESMKDFQDGAGKNLDPEKLAALKKNYRFVTSSPEVVKGTIGTIFPTINYGSAGTSIIQANIQTNGNTENANLDMTRGKNPEELASFAKLDTIQYTVMPIEANFTSLGCPYIMPGQQYFIDFQTNTDVDDVYTIQEITHDLSPGKFETQFKCTMTQYQRLYQMQTDKIGDAVAAAIARAMKIET